MPASADTEEMRIRNKAVAAEVRAIMARKQISGVEMAKRLGVEQTWFSRRASGRVPWTAGELHTLMDLLDEDITRVFAAGQAALHAARKTNPCLSESATVSDKALGRWARGGLEMGLQLYPSLMSRVDESGIAA